MCAIWISIETEMHYWFCLFCVTSSPFTTVYSVTLLSLGKNKTAIITWYLFLLSNCIHSTDIICYSHPIWVSHHYLLRAENSAVLCNMFPPQKSFFFVQSSSLTAACAPHSPSMLQTLRFFCIVFVARSWILLGEKNNFKPINQINKYVNKSLLLYKHHQSLPE